MNALDNLLGVLRRRFALILGIALIGAALSVLYATSLPREYETTAVIQIELADLPGTSSGQAAGTRAKHRLTLITQQLMARDSLVQVIADLGLFSDTDLSMAEQVTALRKAVRIRQIVEGGESWRPDQVPSGLEITVRLNDPELAAQLANTFLDRILTQSEARRQAQVSQALTFYENEAARVEAKIAALEARIARFKQENAASLPSGISGLRAQLAALRSTELEIERQIIGLRTSANRLREDALERQIAQLEEQRALVAQRIARIEQAIDAAPEAERALNALTRAQDQLQEQLGVITRRRAEAEMEAMLETSQASERFEVLEHALVPENPVAPSRKKIAVAGTALFFVLGLGLALVLEMLNPAIRTASQMEEELGIAPIVTIPDLSRKHHGGSGRNGGLWLSLAAGIAALAGGLWIFLSRVIRRPGLLLRPRQAAGPDMMLERLGRLQ